jgi:hypothetical protein
MRIPDAPWDVATALREFDFWITPSLGEITESGTFKDELARARGVLDALAEATGGFADAEGCRIDRITDVIVGIAEPKAPSERADFLAELAAVLFLVTGKSDNNFKCQFPLFLRDEARRTTLPVARNGKITRRAVPSVIKSDGFMADLAGLPRQEQRELLEKIIGFLLKEPSATRQLFAVGRSY